MLQIGYSISSSIVWRPACSSGEAQHQTIHSVSSRAAETGQIRSLRFLLENGADLVDLEGGEAALERAARYGFAEVVEALSEAGVDINGRDQIFATKYGSPVPPTLAVKLGGHDTLVKMLLENGAEDVDPLTTKDRDGFLSGELSFDEPPMPILKAR